MMGKNLFFRSGQIVLRKKTDGFKQLRAELVVKIFRKKVFGRCSETPAHVFSEIGHRIAFDRIVDDKPILRAV